MSATAQKGSLFERYCVVLEELRVEALRHMKRSRPSLDLTTMDGIPQDPGFYGASGIPVDTTPSDGTNYTELMAEGGHGYNFTGLPGSGLGDFSGWGQFASMVSSGLGNLDGFIDDDTFRL